MIRRPVAAIALALLALGLPPAHAAGDAQYSGSCDFDAATNDDVTGPDRYVGAFRAVIAVFSPSGAVVSADVTCEIHVNGDLAAAATASGTGVVVVAEPLEYTADADDNVDYCTRIDFTSDDTSTVYFCSPLHPPTLPPNNIDEFVGNAIGAAGDLSCTATGGDVHVAGELFWDCPPFES